MNILWLAFKILGLSEILAFLDRVLDRYCWHWAPAPDGDRSQRLWWIRWGLSGLEGILFALVQAFVIYELGFFGLFMDFNTWLRSPAPPEVFFWVAEPRVGFVFLWTLIGGLLAAALQRPGARWTSPYVLSSIAWILTFNGMLSLAGALALLWVERSVRRFLKCRSYRISWGSLLPFLILSFIVFEGRDLFLLLNSTLNFITFRALDRFLILTGAYVAFVILEVGLTMVGLHFYYSTKVRERECC